MQMGCGEELFGPQAPSLLPQEFPRPPLAQTLQQAAEWTPAQVLRWLRTPHHLRSMVSCAA